MLPIWVQVVGFVLAALGGILGGVAAIRQARTAACVAHEEDERKDAADQRAALSHVVNTLSTDYQRLAAVQDKLREQIRTLTEENVALRADLARLKREHEELQAEHAELKAEYVHLKADYEQLQAEHARVTTWARDRGYKDGPDPTREESAGQT
jgi:chromosome segregation ATPase